MTVSLRELVKSGKFWFLIFSVIAASAIISFVGFIIYPGKAQIDFNSKLLQNLINQSSHEEQQSDLIENATMQVVGNQMKIIRNEEIIINNEEIMIALLHQHIIDTNTTHLP